MLTDERIHILIIEDEGILAMEMSDSLEEEGYYVAGIASNGRKALDVFRQNRVDLVLCDITIRGDWDGIETVERLLAERSVPIIYLTALSDRTTILRAKETLPAAYITKPFDAGQLRIAVEMAINNFSVRMLTSTDSALPAATPPGSGKDQRAGPILRVNDALFVKQNYQFIKVLLSEVLFLEADDIYTSIVTTGKKYVVRLSLSNMLERLRGSRLVRTHRSYAINLDRIDSFSEHEVIISGHAIPLGRNYKDEFMKNFPVC